MDQYLETSSNLGLVYDHSHFCLIRNERTNDFIRFRKREDRFGACNKDRSRNGGTGGTEGRGEARAEKRREVGSPAASAGRVDAQCE